MFSNIPVIPNCQRALPLLPKPERSVIIPAARISWRQGIQMTNDFPSFDLKGQIALVTGAARGLGRAISLALAHPGADIALGLRDISSGGELVHEIEAS